MVKAKQAMALAQIFVAHPGPQASCGPKFRSLVPISCTEHQTPALFGTNVAKPTRIHGFLETDVSGCLTS